MAVPQASGLSEEEPDEHLSAYAEKDKRVVCVNDVCFVLGLHIISDGNLKVRQHILNTTPVLVVHTFRDLLLGEPGKVCDRFSWSYLTGHNVCLEKEHASLSRVDELCRTSKSE